MKLKIIYSKSTELDTLKYYLSEAKFFIEYNYKVSLPKGLTLLNYQGKNLKEINSQEFEQRKDKYKRAETSIQKLWEEKSFEINNFFNKLGYRKPSIIKIFLTRYGPGGSYRLPDTIAVKIDRKTTLVDIIHEIIHLIIEKPLAEKYKLSHWQKENLVEYFFTTKYFKRVFPNHKPYEGYIEPKKELLDQIKWG